MKWMGAMKCLVEAWKKLKQKEVGCSIWQSEQSRRLLQQWWNLRKRYRNSHSRMRFSCVFICLQKAFAFFCSFRFYLSGTSFCKVSWPGPNILFNLMKKGLKFRNNVNTKNLISVLHFATGLDFLALWHILSFFEEVLNVGLVHLCSLTQKC